MTYDTDWYKNYAAAHGSAGAEGYIADVKNRIDTVIATGTDPRNPSRSTDESLNALMAHYEKITGAEYEEGGSGDTNTQTFNDNKTVSGKVYEVPYTPTNVDGSEIDVGYNVAVNDAEQKSGGLVDKSAAALGDIAGALAKVAEGFASAFSFLPQAVEFAQQHAGWIFGLIGLSFLSRIFRVKID